MVRIEWLRVGGTLRLAFLQCPLCDAGSRGSGSPCGRCATVAISELAQKWAQRAACSLACRDSLHDGQTWRE